VIFRCVKLAVITSLVVLPDIERPQKEGSNDACTTYCHRRWWPVTALALESRDNTVFQTAWLYGYDVGRELR